MTGLFILITILFFFISILVYLVILGSNMNKPQRERDIEDDEQIRSCKEHENKKIMKKINKMNKKKSRLGKR